MSKLEWDKSGEKLYETGVKNCALYVQDKNGTYPKGIAWNGITGITESPSGAEASALYADDIKYLNLISNEDFGATLEAYTYPKEFNQCNGDSEIIPGLSLGQQNRKSFGLAYRTTIGNDIDGNSYGYKTHLVYGAKAAPSEKAYGSINDSPEAITFSWELSTTPVEVKGHKPTASMVIDSTKVNNKKLAIVESKLYGSEDAEAYLPLPDEILTILSDDLYLNWDESNQNLYMYKKTNEENSWLRYTFGHRITNSKRKQSKISNGNALASCYDVWLMRGIYIMHKENGEYAKTYAYPIVHDDAEWEMAIKEVINNDPTKEQSDFVGGTQHGNEVVDSLSFIVNGKTYTKENISELTGITTKEVKIIRHSKVYRNNTLEFDTNSLNPTAGTQIATHDVIYTVTCDNVVIDQNLNWIVNTMCNYSVMAMLGAKRLLSDGATQVSDTCVRCGEDVEYDCSVANFTSPVGVSLPNIKKAILWNSGKKGGLKCTFTAEVLEETPMNGADAKNFKISKDAKYNKMYFGYCAGGQTVANGDVWHCKARYSIDYEGIYPKTTKPKLNLIDMSNGVMTANCTIKNEADRSYTVTPTSYSKSSYIGKDFDNLFEIGKIYTIGYKIKPTNTGTSCAVIFDEGNWTTTIKRLDTSVTNINDYVLVVRNYAPKDNSVRVGFGMKTLPTGTKYNIKDMFIIEGSYTSDTLPDNIF